MRPQTGLSSVECMHMYMQLSILITAMFHMSDACPDLCECDAGRVDCSYRGLHQVPGGIPQNTTHLYLNNNNLTRISRGTFVALLDLRIIDLTNCQIREIKPLSLSMFPSLQSLKLSHNFIQNLSPFSLGSINVKDLYLDNNPLRRISSRAFENTSIEELNLNYCKLETIPRDAFKDTKTHLKVLYLSNNERKPLVLPRGIFSGVTFKEIHLNRNGLLNLNCLEGASAQIVESNGNRFGNAVWTALEQMKYIKEGNFLENEITDIYFKQPVISLTYLSLANNRISQLNANSFENVTNLFTFNLNNNNITEIPSDFDRYLQHLTILDLGNNRLSDLAFTALDGTNLTFLDLSRNRFEIIQEHTRRLFEEIDTVVLYDNPMRCNCQMLSFYKWAKELTYEDTRLWGAMCQTPRKVIISQLEREDLLCELPVITAFVNLNDKLDIDSSFTLECIAHGEPPPSLHITTPSGVSKVVPPVHGEPSTVNSIVFSLNFTCADIGKHYCMASNSEGNETQSLFLDVPGDSCAPKGNDVTDAEITTSVDPRGLHSTTAKSIKDQGGVATTSSAETEEADANSVTYSVTTDRLSLTSTSGVKGSTSYTATQELAPFSSTMTQVDGGFTRQLPIQLEVSTTSTPTSVKTTFPLDRSTVGETSPSNLQRFAIIFGVIVLSILIVLIAGKLIYWSRTAKKEYNVSVDPNKFVYGNPMTDSDKVI